MIHTTDESYLREQIVLIVTSALEKLKEEVDSILEYAEDLEEARSDIEDLDISDALNSVRLDVDDVLEAISTVVAEEVQYVREECNDV